LSGTSDDRVLFPVRHSDESSAEDAAAQGVAQEVVENGEAEAEDEEEEQALQAKPLRVPRAPTAAERAAHEATHLPFRSWCEACVAGRRDNPAHRGVKIGEDELAVPELGMDYCFVRREDEEEVITVIVIKDSGSRAIRATRVLQKGAESESEAARVVECVRSFGHRGKVVLKSDGEPAILALKEAIARRLPDGAVTLESAPTESESNGAVENAVKLVKGMIRVHLLALERKVGGRFPGTHPVLAWLIEHVSDLITKYVQGADGRTAYERLYGKECMRKHSSSESAFNGANAVPKTVMSFSMLGGRTGFGWDGGGAHAIIVFPWTEKSLKYGRSRGAQRLIDGI
jgi:hypothetical protein